MSQILTNEYGNVLFVDPNAVAANDTVNIYNVTLSPENIRPHLEFYCIPRIGTNIILDSNNNVSLVEDNNVNTKVNFLGFDKETGNYTNQYLTELSSSGKRTSFEGFGITNINIKISANYVPEVNIEFIDIKGKTISDINSPYRRLFDLPPPLFKLVIKGGYGLFTEFDLYITKHEVSTDDSQNLIIKADFIGDRYGVLTDVLLGYLNSVYFMNGNTSIDLSAQSKAGSFYEFITRSKVLYANVDKFKKNSPEIQEQEAIKENIRIIKESDTLITNLLDITNIEKQLEDFYDSKGDKYKNTLSKSDIIPSVITITNVNILTIALDNRFVTDFISNYIQKSLKDILDSINNTYSIGLESYNIKNDVLAARYTNLGSNPVPVGVNFTDLINKNKNNLIKLEDRLKNLNQELRNKAEDIVTTTISSEPTIGNIFSFILKDTDTFLKLLKESGDSGASQRISTKDKSLTTRGGYPTVVNSRNEIIYPGEVPQFKNFPEVKFVEKYLTALINKKLTDSQVERQLISQGTDSSESGNKNYIPISSDEAYNTRTQIISNYYFGINNDLQKIFESVILRYVILRDSIYYEKFNNDNILEFYAKAEANNIVYSMLGNKKLLQSLVDGSGLQTIDNKNYYEGIITNIFKNKAPVTFLPIDKGGVKEIKNNGITYYSTSASTYSSIYGIYDDNQFTFSQTIDKSGNDIIDTFINESTDLVTTIFKFLGVTDNNELSFNKNFFFKKDNNYDYDNIQSDFNMKGQNIINLSGIENTYDYIQYIAKRNSLTSISINQFLFLEPETTGTGRDIQELQKLFIKKLNSSAFIEIPYFFLVYFGFLLKNKDNDIYKKNVVTIYLNVKPIDSAKLIKIYDEFNNAGPFIILPKNSSGDNDITNFKNFKEKLWNKKIILISNNDFSYPGTPPFDFLGGVRKPSFFNKINDGKNINKYLTFLIQEMINIATAYKNDINEEEKNIRSEINDNDLKEHVYYNFKTIYERFLTGKEYRPFADLNGQPINSSFQFVDRIYNDISQKVILTYDKLVDDSKTDDISIYTSISNLLSHNNFIFFPFQSFIASGDSNLDYWKQCFQVNNSYTKENISKPSFVCMFTGGYSSYLNTNNDSHPDDGVSIYSVNENGNVINNLLPLDFTTPQSGTTTLNKIFCFRYNFAQQNEAVFNGINLSTTQFNNTDASLKIQDSVINQQYNSNPLPKGQSLLSVYRNLSYTLSSGIYYGNASIQPTQYIQLDNVPLFNGLYMIYEVEHKMSTNNRLETSFKAYRINKYIIRLVKDYALDIFGIDTGVEEELDSNTQVGSTVNNNSNDTIILQSNVPENSTQFVQKVKDIAVKLNTQPDWIMLFIDTESSFRKDIVNGSFNNNVGLIQTLRPGLQGLIQTYKLGDFKNNTVIANFKKIYANAPYVNINANSELDKTKGYFYTGKIENYTSNDQLDFVYMLLNMVNKIFPKNKNPYPTFYHLKAYGFEPYNLYSRFVYGKGLVEDENGNFKTRKIPEAKGDTILSTATPGAIASNSNVFNYAEEKLGTTGTFQNMVEFFNDKLSKKPYYYRNLGTLVKTKEYVFPLPKKT